MDYWLRLKSRMSRITIFGARPCWSIKEFSLRLRMARKNKLGPEPAPRIGLAECPKCGYGMRWPNMQAFDDAAFMRDVCDRPICPYNLSDEALARELEQMEISHRRMMKNDRLLSGLKRS